MNSFIAITILIALSLFLNNQPTQSWENRAVVSTQRALASELDAELPRLSFAEWFEKVVGQRSGVIWQLSECGDRVETAPNGTEDARACVEANTILPDGRRVIVMIAVGTFKKGMTDAPTFHFGVIEQKGVLRRVPRLRDLQNLLLAPGNPTKRPAVNLPEVSMPSVRPAANKAYSIGTPLWTGEDFSQLMPIDDLEPPPPEPPRTRPATSTSTSTSNAERRNESDGVRQGAPIFKPQPKYPQNARRFNASGRVEVRVTISVAGRVTKAIAISGHPLLRDAAVEAARRWEFEPTLANGVPVETELTLTFDFAAPPP
jgi:TonB family protein